MKRSLALFGAVAVMMFTVTIVVTLSRTTLFADGVGGLKCYDKGGIEKAC